MPRSSAKSRSARRRRCPASPSRCGGWRRRGGSGSPMSRSRRPTSGAPRRPEPARPGRRRAPHTASGSTPVVVSSVLMERVSSSTRRRLTPRATASRSTSSACSGTRTVTVSKVPVRTLDASVAETVGKGRAYPWVRRAIAASPAGPCQATYMLAITARRTWAVQMFEVAFSRRMCCSRVCSASPYAGWPAESTETPTRRPGICRSRRTGPACSRRADPEAHRDAEPLACPRRRCRRPTPRRRDQA